MEEKQDVTKDVYVTVLQRLSDKDRARLPKSECPAAEMARLSVARLNADIIKNHEIRFRS